ncbi:MAG: SDR family NAD(P)-dependent oxidoreductase, partial [Flexibacteraceae bacterium]
QQINEAGGIATASQVDALDEEAIETYLKGIAEVEGKIDIVFNGIGLRPFENGYGTPAAMLPFADFLKPLETIVGSQFLTARLASKYMTAGGTILLLTSSLSRIKTPFMSGISAASAAIEGLTRSLAAEFGFAGIRVICLNPTGMPETKTIQETAAANAKTLGIPVEAFAAELGKGYLLGKAPAVSDTAKVAAFLVSDAGSALNSHIIDVDFGHQSVI